MTSTDKFSFDTIRNFDEHIDQSIPNYSLLQSAIISLSEFVVQPNTAIVDIGCSTGKLLKAIPHKGDKIGIDISENLLPPSDEEVRFLNQDIRTLSWELLPKTSMFLSVFTLQFIPKQDRQGIIDNIHDALEPEGVFVWAEKTVCEEGWQQELMTFSHYDYKRKSFTADEIMNKEQNLRQMMRCNTSKKNHALAISSGFSHSQLVWKFFNFECWVFKK